MSDVVKLYSRVDGKGPPILLMHGLFGSHRNWFSVQRQLAKAGWEVHGLDLRNHGSSGWADDMDYGAMSDDVIAYLDERQIDGAVVLGHSMGGKVAMSLALRFPARLRALVVVDIAPVRYEPSLRTYLDAMLALPLDQVSSRRDADRLLAERVTDDGIRGFLLQNLVTNERGAYEWRINLPAIDTELATLGEPPAGLGQTKASGFHGPVQAIYGEQSEYMRAKARTAMQDVFPTAQLAPVSNAGHWVHAEQPTAFYRALTGFLESL